MHVVAIHVLGRLIEGLWRLEIPRDGRGKNVGSPLVEGDLESLIIGGRPAHVNLQRELAPAAVVSDVEAAYTPSWNPFEPGVLVVTYALQNSGNTRITGRETLATSGPVGLFGTTGPGTQLSEVIPGSTIEVRREVPVMSLGWLAGSMTVAAEGVGLGAGSVTPIVAEFSTPAIPWSLYALLLLALVLVIVVVLLVRRRERRASAADAG